MRNWMSNAIDVRQDGISRNAKQPASNAAMGQFAIMYQPANRAF